MKPRIFVSVPDDRHLDDRRRGLKRAIISVIAGLGFNIVGFEPEQFGMDSPVNLDAWTIDRAKTLLQRCDGVLVLALARQHVHAADVGSGRLIEPLGVVPKPIPTPYNHLEGALGIALGLQILVILERGMDRNGIFDSGIKPVVIPDNATDSWAQSPDFWGHLPVWTKRILERRDLFLGYWYLFTAPEPSQLAGSSSL